MRFLLRLSICCLAIAVAAAGCGREDFSEDEFGTLVFEIPEVPGTDKPYEMPELTPTQRSPARHDT